MELEKELIIQEMVSKRDGPIILTTSEERFGGGYTSNLYLDESVLRRFGIDPSSDLVQRILVVKLESRKPKVEDRGGRYFWDMGTDDLFISKIERKEIQSLDIHVNPPTLRNYVEYVAHFERGVVPPDERSFGELNPYYRLQFGVSEKQYIRLKELPAHILMKMSLSVK